MMTWLVIMLTALGCYGLKLSGLSVPEEWLEHPVVSRMAGLLPLALLGALVAVQTFASGQALVIDARVIGVAAAVVALLLRAPFIVVVLVAAFTAAAARAIGAA